MASELVCSSSAFQCHFDGSPQQAGWLWKVDGEGSQGRQRNGCRSSLDLEPPLSGLTHQSCATIVISVCVRDFATHALFTAIQRPGLHTRLQQCPAIHLSALRATAGPPFAETCSRALWELRRGCSIYSSPVLGYLDTVPAMTRQKCSGLSFYCNFWVGYLHTASAMTRPKCSGPSFCGNFWPGYL